MSFTWTPHRFSGGALALDVANAVVLRFDPARRIDRFADPAAIDGFADAARRHCAEVLPALAAPRAEDRPLFLALREAIDAHFRAIARGGAAEDAALATLLETIAAVIRRGAGDGATRLDVQTAHSALRLAALPDPARLKICPHCEWLFLDRSRNRSRTWCDMAVCGNRTKARRHYRRSKEHDA
ncbi:CGNR zinc finger domain-containing protein [Ensifer soli]|uniref:CGNR zinc finger domain-containing protein n=1 Tax=Ciceribacter sp. sgz301302 TaxID=3342379 RepID=UPI0035B73019